MRKHFVNFYALALVLNITLLSSCATSFNMSDIDEQLLSLNAKSDSITLNYKPIVLSGHYLKMTAKHDVTLFSIRLVNKSQQDLKVGKQIMFIDSIGNEISLLDNNQGYKALRQRVSPYLLYLLLTPLNIIVKGEEESTSTARPDQFVPIGLIFGPIAATGNMLIAGKSNKRLKKGIVKQNLLGQMIKAGEEYEGLIVLKSNCKKIGLRLLK